MMMQQCLQLIAVTLTVQNLTQARHVILFKLTVQTYGTTPLTGPGRLWYSVRADL